MSIARFIIDGKEYQSETGKFIVEAAADNGVFIPTICNIPGVKPRGACRMCTVKVNGRYMAACSTPIGDNMEIENDTAEIRDLRSAIIESMFVSGDHYCPSCEKSGNCVLQAHAYKLQMLVPRFPYLYPMKGVDASNPKIYKDQNRCIQCKRCIRTIKDEQGRSLFAFQKRGHHISVEIDHSIAVNISDELAQKAMDVCPVGSILVKETGYKIPIGKRKYDVQPIGSEIVNK